ncbi:MAG: M48 family metallopeptidase [Burkholderiaceae bacterium]
MNAAKSLVAALGALVLLLSLNACETGSTTQGGAVGVERKQFFAVSSQQIEASSAQAYQKLLEKERKNGTLDRNPQQVQRIRAIAARLIPQTSAFRADAPAWSWEQHVIESKELNAWCMAGGKIAVYSGLIEKLNLTDDEIAAVMGHEIAHALREHSREQASEQMVTGVGLSIGGALLGLNQAQMSLADTVMNVTIGLPHSRKHEVEADRMGVELAARAGYDPHAAVSLWKKMGSAAGSSGPPEFLSTHPAPENRLRDLETYAQRVYPLYQQQRSGRRQ